MSEVDFDCACAKINLESDINSKYYLNYVGPGDGNFDEVKKIFYLFWTTLENVIFLLDRTLHLWVISCQNNFLLILTFKHTKTIIGMTLWFHQYILISKVFVSPAKHIWAAHRDHFVWRLSVCPSVFPCVCLSGSHTFLVVTRSYVSRRHMHSSEWCHYF